MPMASVPSASAPMAPAGMMSSPAGAMSANATGARTSVIPAFADPFKGYIPPPRNYSSSGRRRGHGEPPKPPEVPIYMVPGINTQPTSGGAKFNDKDVNTGQIPQQLDQQVALNLGRSAGWMAGNGAGKITAYFQSQDGGISALNVGSEIAGYRVKAINVAQEYLVLVDMQSGIEEKVRLQSARSAT
jgi:hypothetical protein